MTALPVPSWLRVVRAAGVSRDFVIVAAGAVGLSDTPPSVASLGAHGVGAFAWALMLFVGGCVSAFGVLNQQPAVESAGCFTVGAGFLVWFVAALSQPNPTAASVMVALVFLAGVFGQVYRGVMVSSGLFGMAD